MAILSCEELWRFWAVGKYGELWGTMEILGCGGYGNFELWRTMAILVCGELLAILSYGGLWRL